MLIYSATVHTFSVKRKRKSFHYALMIEKNLSGNYVNYDLIFVSCTHTQFVNVQGNMVTARQKGGYSKKHYFYNLKVL